MFFLTLLLRGPLVREGVMKYIHLAKNRIYLIFCEKAGNVYSSCKERYRIYIIFCEKADNVGDSMISQYSMKNRYNPLNIIQITIMV